MFTPQAAIVLYQEGDYGDKYAQVHSVDQAMDTGNFEMGAGRPASQPALRKVLGGLFMDWVGKSQLTLLPDNVKAFDIVSRSAMWVLPPERRYLRIGGKGQWCSLPKLLFYIENGKHLRVFALESGQEFGCDTKLYHAPLYNFYRDGKMCWGSVVQPEFGDTDSLHNWERAVFGTMAMHENHSDLIKGYYASELPTYFKHLGVRKFPKSRLSPTEFTVGSLLMGSL